MTGFSIEATTVVCCRCGIPFSIPLDYENKLRQSRERFYCPNGHTLVFNGLSESEKLKQRLDQKQNELAGITAQKIQLENQLTKANKKLKSLTEGKCPCCDKTFKHLANHMKNQHPTFKQ